MAKRGQALRRARAVRKAAKPPIDLKQEIAGLKRELAQALERQAATSEVLQVISSSSGELKPVFDAMLEKAMQLCEAAFGGLWTFDGDRLVTAALRGVPADYAEYIRGTTLLPGPGTAPYRFFVAGERSIIQNIDLAAEEPYRAGDPQRRALVDLGGARTALQVPLIKDDVAVGVITIYRQEVRPFPDKQIALVQNFAAQAVIAMENARLITETREALEQQTATTDVLQVINASPGDLGPVFDAMLDKAMRLCGAAFGYLDIYDGERFGTVVIRGAPAAFEQFRKYNPPVYGPDTGHARLLAGEPIVHIADLMAEEVYNLGEPNRRAVVDLGGARTLLGVPLRRHSTLLGVFWIYRQEVRPFSDKQIALLQNFAAQAVIAMENARLITETREALEQQTATADVLQVINSSPGELAPVFEAILEKAHRLCGVANGNLVTKEGEYFRTVAMRRRGGVTEGAVALLRRPFRAMPNTPYARLSAGERVVHISDITVEEGWDHNDPRLASALGIGLRTMLFVPLRKDDALLGYISANRHEVRPYSDKEIKLLESFAAQAVIAMENARLLGELRQRTTDLARSVDELTATGDVLKIISRSSVDLDTVLHTLVETVARLCGADQANMFRRRDDMYHLIASYGLSQEAKEFVVAHPFAPGRGSLNGRVALERRAVHIPDVLQDPEYLHREAQKVLRHRSALGVPLLRGDELIGIFAINRTRVEPFTSKEIELAASFADQAVIAIENTRLFEELRDRQAELRVTFDNMGDGVAMFGADRRLAAWNRNFQVLLDLPDAFLAGRPSHAESFRYLVERGEFGSADLEAELRGAVEDTSREMRYERTRPDGHVVEVRRNPVPGGGFVMIYSDITERKRAEEAIRAARDAAESALRELQTAQASLVHAQKMAALGQLTAGIAHEIKNPLNFVNNFAGLSVELLDELKQASAQAMGAVDADKRAEIVETIGMLTSNLEKIAEHGRRADGIVKSMLQHSRGGSGDWQAVDLNALVEEALNLAYHGARAQDQSFNITMERDLDPNLAPIEVVPQDLMRVFLNLIGNGFYAANKRSRTGDGAFRPVLKVTTRDLGEAVEIQVRDNGIGIPREYREKLFQPFFTTKPTGEGTGLGLSISFEIVTQQHGGTITVDSEVGQFAEFKVRLPRRRHPALGRTA